MLEQLSKITAAWQQFGNIRLSIAVTSCQILATPECRKPAKNRCLSNADKCRQPNTAVSRPVAIAQKNSRLQHSHFGYAFSGNQAATKDNRGQRNFELQIMLWCGCRAPARPSSGTTPSPIPPSAVCPSGTLHSHCAAQIWHKKRPRWRPKRVDYMPKSSGKIPPTRARNSGPKISGHIKGSGDSHGLQDSVLAARPTYQSRRPMWIVHTFGPDQFFGPFRSKLTAARWAKKNLISASSAVTIMRAIRRKARMARRAK